MTNKRYEDPIGVTGVVDELPSSGRGSAATDAAITAIMEQAQKSPGKYVQIDPAGRKVSSAQATLKAAIQRRELPLELTTRNGILYAFVEAEEETATKRRRK